MKNIRHILTILFSVYLLGLMVLPCSESHAMEAGRHRSESQSQDKHDHDAELCTPFCVCGSCVTAIVLYAPIDFQLLESGIPFQDQVSNFYQSVTSDFHGSIWQPPQLV